MHKCCRGQLHSGALQDVIEGYLKPMRSDNWDRGSLLSLRAMSFPGTYPYERIIQPVLTIIGENDKFLLKTAQRVRTTWPACPQIA